MAGTVPLFPTTVVGSMPRPQYIKDLLAAGSRTGTPDAAWRRHMDDAVRYVIGMQEQAGIDIISDGEWRRESYVDVVGEIMNGYRWVKREVFAYHQVITERMTPRRGNLHGLIKRARSLAPLERREQMKRESRPTARRSPLWAMEGRIPIFGSSISRTACAIA